MATLEQANTYNTMRGNAEWSKLTTSVATSLLEDAEAYLRGSYSIRATLTVAEQRIFDGLVCRLASIFQITPPQGAATAPIKSEKKEGAGFKKEVEYNTITSDPYPYIAVAIRPLLTLPSSGVVFARLVR